LFQVTDDKLKAKVIVLPYQGDDVFMVVFLPTSKPQKNSDPISKLVGELTSIKLQEILADLDNVEDDSVKLFFPKFKSDATYELKQVNG
jgi:serine protease inhibitor